MAAFTGNGCDVRRGNSAAIGIGGFGAVGVAEEAVLCDGTIEIEKLHRLVTRRNIPARRLVPGERRFEEIVTDPDGVSTCLEPAADLQRDRILRGEAALCNRVEQTSVAELSAQSARR